MDDKGSWNPCLVVSEEKIDCLYPMCFGVSCAFFALRLLSKPAIDNERGSDIWDKMLLGSAQLLGLLVWRAQREGVNGDKFELLHKLENAEREIEELKKQRREDAKANEKVVCIFAAQEQCWFNERKKLRQHIGALINEVRVLESKKGGEISELNGKLKEMEDLMQSKDKVLEVEEERKRKEIEERLKNAEAIAEELRGNAKREAQEYSSELRKHKTAFVELVSNQRQLEAEMGRALRQVEAAKQELDSVYEQKEESVLMVQKLSVEMVKMRNDMEQKDKILSAMLRKSKLDTTEKEMLLKEIKLSKAKRKQAELETERLRTVSEARHERHSLRSMLSTQGSSKLGIVSGAKGVNFTATGSSLVENTRSQTTDISFQYENPEFGMEAKLYSPRSDQISPEENESLAITANAKRLEAWVHSEAERFANVVEQRHHLEIEAFAEQMRVKDEKLEACRWRLMSMELESKRLQSHIERLNEDMSQLKHHSMKLEAVLMEREAELSSLKRQVFSQLKSVNSQRTNSKSSLNDLSLGENAVWSKVKIVKRKPGEKEHETNTNLVEISQEKDNEKEEEVLSLDESKDITVIVETPKKEIEQEKDVAHGGSSPTEFKCASPVEIDTTEKLASPSPSLNKTNNSTWRVDLQALGVSFKIKRLKQQLLMLERLTGKQEATDNTESSHNEHVVIRDFHLLMSLLNKQVNRYQSLQGKTDDLCKCMHENGIDVSHGDTSTPRNKGETKKLEHFLEETFQLQRYIVATGQKLMEIQSKIASGTLEGAEELNKSASFDMKRFADNARTLFQEVQRGLEVQIARLIGDLEGTLAFGGMIHFRR